MVAEVRERLSVRKQAAQRFDVDRVNLKKRYQIEYQGKYLKAKINKRGVVLPPSLLLLRCFESNLGWKNFTVEGFSLLNVSKAVHSCL